MPFFKGIDGSESGYSQLKSSILNKKFLNLFYELFERQKNEKAQKKNLKKQSNKDHWEKLARLTQSEMSYSNF